MLLGLCLVQVVLWVGLGILVVSTHTTLSVSEEAPVDLAEEAPAGQLEEAEGIIKAEAARLPGMQLPGARLPGAHTAPQPPRGTLVASPQGRGVQKALSRLSHLPLSCWGGKWGRGPPGQGTATCLPGDRWQMVGSRQQG